MAITAATPLPYENSIGKVGDSMILLVSAVRCDRQTAETGKIIETFKIFNVDEGAERENPCAQTVGVSRAPLEVQLHSVVVQKPMYRAHCISRF